MTNQHDILTIIGKYVNLKKIGSDYRGLCPLHSERTPSFYVQPSKQRFKCFGCGAGGDAIDFIRRLENSDYKGAVAILTGGSPTNSTYRPPAPKQVKPFAIPAERLSLKYSDNFTTCTLWYFFRQLFPSYPDAVDQVFADYGVMAGAYGLNVFPYRDAGGHIRQIKELAADPHTGRRDRAIMPKFAGKALTSDAEREEYELIKCFYGEHLITANPAMPIVIVESEKTAIGMTITERIWAAPNEQHLWLATGGKYGARMDSTDALQPLKGKKVVLMPDNDAAPEWAKYGPAIGKVAASVKIADKLARNERSADRAKYDIWDYTLDEIRAQQARLKQEFIGEFTGPDELPEQQQRNVWADYQRRGMLPIVARAAVQELINKYGFKLS